MMARFATGSHVRESWEIATVESRSGARARRRGDAVDRPITKGAATSALARELRNPAAWLTTVTTRLCLDLLRKRREVPCQPATSPH